LAPYETQYAEVVRRLARRIVDIGKAAGPGPATPVVLDDVEVPESSLSGMRLSVMVLAPNGRIPSEWFQFDDRLPFSSAELAANVAERRGMAPRLTGAHIEFGPLAESATLVLVDPWIADSPQGWATLDAVVERLPDWAVVVAVADGQDPSYRQRASEFDEVLSDKLGTRRQVRRILDAAQLVERMLAGVDETREVFLRTAPVFLPKGVVLSLPGMVANNGSSRTDGIDV
jgi:hypothetical protein